MGTVKAVREQNRLWHESSGCRQAKYFLHGPDHSRARFALNLARKDLRILVGLLTSHADLNQHLCIMGIRQDSGCPLSQEEDDTTVHLIAQCSALMLLRKEILGDFTLSLDTLSDFHPPEVCQSYKEVLSTLRSVGGAHWARAVASALTVCLAGIRPEGKVGVR